MHNIPARLAPAATPGASALAYCAFINIDIIYNVCIYNCVCILLYVNIE